MRIYSDHLDEYSIHKAARGILFIDSARPLKRPRIRSRGWEVKTSGNTSRWKNSGRYGAERIPAASWDQHGQFFARLYAIDPAAWVAIYQSAEDFSERTQGKYPIPAQSGA